MIFLANTLFCLACLWFARSEVFRLRAQRGARLLYPALWVALGLVLGLLALQQATGMLGAITDAARQDAMTEGWYGDRRPFQWMLVRAVPALALIVGVGAFWSIRRAWRRYLLVLVAMLCSASFAAIQGISFHNIDWLLRQHTAGLQNKTWGDLVGMALTLAALVVAWRMDRRQGVAWGRTPEPAPAPAARTGRLYWIAQEAGRDLRAEARVFTAWYARYRAHRHRSKVGGGASGRRK